MPRYALIDKGSGYVWGVEDALSPLSAAKQLDERCGGYFAEHRFSSDFNSPKADGYFVHEVPPCFDVVDGRHPAEINEVLQHKPCGFIQMRRAKL